MNRCMQTLCRPGACRSSVLGPAPKPAVSAPGFLGRLPVRVGCQVVRRDPTLLTQPHAEIGPADAARRHDLDGALYRREVTFHRAPADEHAECIESRAPARPFAAVDPLAHRLRCRCRHARDADCALLIDMERRCVAGFWQEELSPSWRLGWRGRCRFADERTVHCRARRDPGRRHVARRRCDDFRRGPLRKGNRRGWRHQQRRSHGYDRSQ